VRRLIEQLKPLLGAINEYGVTVLVIGVFIMLVWQTFVQKQQMEKIDKERQTQQDDYFRNLNEEQQKYLQNLLDRSMYALKDSLCDLKNENHLKDEPDNFQYNNSIVDAMTEALNLSGASHGFFFSYHNGGKDYEGRSYQRMSCIDEVTNGQVQPLQSKYNNMFRTSIYYIYKALSEDGFYDIVNVESIKEKDPGTYHMLLQDNIKANIGCAIKNKNNETIGFIALAFTEPVENKDKIINYLKRCKYKIEGIYSTL
jgi:hypothetical protein